MPSTPPRNHRTRVPDLHQPEQRESHLTRSRAQIVDEDKRNWNNNSIHPGQLVYTECYDPSEMGEADPEMVIDADHFDRLVYTEYYDPSEMGGADPEMQINADYLDRNPSGRRSQGDREYRYGIREQIQPARWEDRVYDLQQWANPSQRDNRMYSTHEQASPPQRENGIYNIEDWAKPSQLENPWQGDNRDRVMDESQAQHSGYTRVGGSASERDSKRVKEEVRATLQQEEKNQDGIREVEGEWVPGDEE
ncbi:hypothetical protein BLS_009759 [Venturia inaequalis]|uniref:Uncharacterized protein n=1 Tax=Venturia inaequalis TaxID=5025 RepID=A0A8H3YMG7_VENIN|nr:hypothetical protein BLS_009759 [Venturia inaequalis]